MILAKEMIQSKRAVSKLYATKAHMNSVMLGMKNQCGKLGHLLNSEMSLELSFSPACFNSSIVGVLFLLIEVYFSVP